MESTNELISAEKPDDYDSPWKMAIEHDFRDFAKRFFPLAHDGIDWNKPLVFRDSELMKLTRNAKTGKRIADKLVQVTLRTGKEQMVYVHIEVQGSQDEEIANRVFITNYRIYDAHQLPVASLVVLTDENPAWRPKEFGYSALGCQMGIQFPIAKLTDFAGREDELMRDGNAFSLIIVANLRNQATRKDMERRYAEKWKLIQLLYEHGWDKQRIINLFHVIDWMMTLPEQLTRRLWQNIEILEEKKDMRYVSTVERLIIEREKQQSLQQGIEQGEASKAALLLGKLLKGNFGDLPQWAVEKLATASVEQLDAWFDRAVGADTLEDVFRDMRH